MKKDGPEHELQERQILDSMAEAYIFLYEKDFVSAAERLAAAAMICQRRAKPVKYEGIKDDEFYNFRIRLG